MIRVRVHRTITLLTLAWCMLGWSGRLPAQTRLMDVGCQQACTPDPTCASCQKCIHGVDCADSCGPELRWGDARPLAFDRYGPGEYAGPVRWAPWRDYRVRVGDELRLLYIPRRDVSPQPYRFMVGDQFDIDSAVEEDFSAAGRGGALPLSSTTPFTIQPDGTVSLKLIGEVHAAGCTVAQLRELLSEKYAKFYQQKNIIDVIPRRTNTLLEDILSAVGGQSGLNAPSLVQNIPPDGKLSLPLVGAVCAQGLTLEELKAELNQRYAAVVSGLEVQPTLGTTAPHFVFVLGEVTTPGRYQLNGPTTALGAIALAQGHRVGANLREVVIFRRDEDWRVLATKLDLRGAILGRRPTPADDIWLRDNDYVVVPATPIRLFDNFAQTVFSDGIYRIVPFGGFSVQLGNNNVSN